MSVRNQKLRGSKGAGRGAGASKRGVTGKNARFPERDRKVRLHSRNVAYQPAAPLVIPITWLNTVIGLMLLPVAWVTTLTFFSLLSQSAEQDEGVADAAGGLVWLGICGLAGGILGRAAAAVRVCAGHELTHALFVLLCGGKIHDFRVTADGGHVVTDKNNLLISLSPYFVPFWSLAAVTVYGLLRGAV